MIWLSVMCEQDLLLSFSVFSYFFYLCSSASHFSHILLSLLTSFSLSPLTLPPPPLLQYITFVYFSSLQFLLIPTHLLHSGGSLMKIQSKVYSSISQEIRGKDKHFQISMSLSLLLISFSSDLPKG